MPKRKICVRDIEYVLGNNRHWYDEALNFETLLDQLGLDDDPDFWGWGHYFSSDHSPIDLAISAARKTLTSSKLEPDLIDAVILCSVEPSSDVGNHADYHRRISKELKLIDFRFIGLSLNRCNTMLQGIRLAIDLINSCNFDCILVLASDKVFDQNRRFLEFACFSDGAASCLVSSSAEEGFLVTYSGEIFDFNNMCVGGQISPSMCAKFNVNMVDCTEVPLASIKKVITNNIFTPIVKSNEQRAGVSRGQLFLENTPRFGHCFSADPIINLKDFSQKSKEREYGPLLVSSSVPGNRVGLLLEKILKPILNRPLFAGGPKVSMDGAYGKK